MLSPRLPPASRRSIACLARRRCSLPRLDSATTWRFVSRNVTTAVVSLPSGGGPSRSGTIACPSSSTARRHAPSSRHHTNQLLQLRGKKTRTVVNLDELPQGVVAPPLPHLPEEDEPAYPTVVLQARRHMQKFDNCVLLTRVGGFYELYFDQADEYGPLLNLKVAQKKTSAGPVSMVLFPCLDRAASLLF